MAPVIPRVAMLLVAVVAIAAGAAWLHDARVFARAQDASLKAKTPAQLQRAAARFDDVGTLTPDTLARSAEAYTLLRAGQQAPAEALLEGVLRTEPRNVRAWAALYFADRGRKPARAAFAQAQARRLSPTVK